MLVPMMIERAIFESVQVSKILKTYERFEIWLRFHVTGNCERVHNLYNLQDLSGAPMTITN